MKWVWIILVLVVISCRTISLIFVQPEFPEVRIQNFNEEIVGTYVNPFDNNGRKLSIFRDSILIPKSHTSPFLLDSAVIKNEYDIRIDSGRATLTAKRYYKVVTNSFGLNSDFVSKKNETYFVNIYSGENGWMVVVLERQNKKILRLVFLDKIRDKEVINRYFNLDRSNPDVYKVNAVIKMYDKLIEKGYFPSTSLWQKKD